jgi:hypothetical protein
MKQSFEAYPITFFPIVNPDPLQFLTQHCEKFSGINLNQKSYSKKEIEDFYQEEKRIIDSLKSLIQRLRKAEKGSQERYEAAQEMYIAFGFKVSDANIQETYKKIDEESGIAGDSKIYDLWRHIAEMGSLTIISILEEIGQKLSHQDIQNTQDFGYFPSFYASLKGNFKTFYKLSACYMGAVEGSISPGFECASSDMHNIILLHPQKMREYSYKDLLVPDVFNYIELYDSWDEITEHLKASDLSWHEQETDFVPPECEDDFQIKSLKEHIEQSKDYLDWSPVHWAICLGKYDLILSMMKNQIHVHQSIPNSDYWALDLASLAGHAKIVALFLQILPLVHPLSSQERLNRAIICASYAGKADCLELLLNYAKTNYGLLTYKDSDDVPVLHIACKEGWTDCVELLVLHQLVDDYQGDEFSTLDYAVIKGYVSVVNLLLEKSMLANDKDSQIDLLNKALDLAKEHGQNEVYQLLIQQWDCSAESGFNPTI